MFHPESYRGRIIEFKCFALLYLFNGTCMILLALHKLSGKDGLCPGSYLDYGSPGGFYFFNGLRVLLYLKNVFGLLTLYNEPSWCYMGSVLSPFLSYAPSLLFC